jgi:hypothetical protein
MSEIKEISPSFRSIRRDGHGVGSKIAKGAPAVLLKTQAFENPGRDRIGREYTDNRLTKIFAYDPGPEKSATFRDHAACPLTAPPRIRI